MEDLSRTQPVLENLCCILAVWKVRTIHVNKNSQPDSKDKMSSGLKIVGPFGPVGHLHLWSNSEDYLKDQMSDRSLESLPYSFGHIE